MHKSFDKILASRINEVFLNHQEPYKPADWEKLRARISNKKKGIVIWYSFIAKAASVAILIGLSIFSLNDLKKIDSENKFSDQVLNNYILSNDSLEITVPVLNQQQVLNHHDIQHVINSQGKNLKTNYSINLIGDKVESLKNANISFANNDSLYMTDNLEIRMANFNKEIEKQQKEIIRIGKAKPDTNKIGLIGELTDNEFVEKKRGQNKFDFGVEVASVSNYAAEGDGSSFNIGGGFSTAWNFSKKISLATGILIAQQSINCNQNQSSNLVKADLIMNGSSAVYGDANSLKSVDMNTAESKVEFIGMDIPLNVQFKFSRILLTTGISSLLYIQEKYTYSYNASITNTTYNAVSKQFEIQNTVNQVTEQQQIKSFDRFDFARLVNVAVGYKLPLNKGDIMFEPYLKLPVGNISSYNIKMGSGGMAFRYIF